MTAASVILTTYSRPHDLLRTLEGLRQQTFQDFELLVCDDGSGRPTREVIESFAASVPFPVHHAWQEDVGFRAARSRNNGARRAIGDTLVFVDGDCLPLPNFLEIHVRAQRPDQFQAGERYLLERDESDQVAVEGIASGEAFADIPKRELRRVGSIRRKDVFYRLSGLKPERPRLMTSNCSMPRAVFMQANGLDERYEGWGQEDEDLRRRLVRLGFRPGSVIGTANCLHLWHNADATFLGTRKQSPNWNYYHRGFQLSRCRRGIRKRPLSDIRSDIRGPAPLVDQAREVLGLGPAPDEGDPLEVEVLLDPGGDSPPPRASGTAEVTVCIRAGPLDPRRLNKVDLVLAPRARAQGGELPTEEHAPLEPRLAQAGVKAVQPLPDGPLDEAALAAAAACLDARL